MKKSIEENEIIKYTGSGKIKWIIALIVGLIIAIGTVATATNISVKSDNRIQEFVDLGNRYMDELEYELAIAEYKSAFELSPNDIRFLEAIDNAYHAWSNSYLDSDMNRAAEILEELVEYYDSMASKSNLAELKIFRERAASEAADIRARIVEKNALIAQAVPTQRPTVETIQTAEPESTPIPTTAPSPIATLVPTFEPILEPTPASANITEIESEESDEEDEGDDETEESSSNDDGDDEDNGNEASSQPISTPTAVNENDVPESKADNKTPEQQEENIVIKTSRDALISNEEALAKVYSKGEIIKFGQYYTNLKSVSDSVSEALKSKEQGYYFVNDEMIYWTEAGNVYDTKPVTWIVLEDMGDSVLVLSEYVLEGRYYSSDTTAYIMSYGDSQVRAYINSNTFWKKYFTDDECTQMLTTSLNMEGNTYSDKMFLPSVDELNDYFSSDADRIAHYHADWAVPNVTTPITTGNSIAYNKPELSCAYWTRICDHTHYGMSQPTYVGCDGIIRTGGRVYYTWSSGVRPMLKINKTFAMYE